jgi:hypothetical protein
MTVATIGAPLSILVAAILTSASLQAVTPEEPRIVRSIIYDQKDIFEEGDTDWFFAAPLLNALHTITRPYLIDDELLVLEGDDADSIRLLETERNLRRTGLFSSVKVSVVNVGEDSVDIIIATQEAWSLKPALLLGTGGGISNVGFKLEETNLAGTATQVMGYGLYRTENDIGWEGMLQLYQRRLFRTEVGLNAALRANQYRTDQVLAFTKPYRTMSTPWAFSVNGRNAYGRDFAYRIDTTVLLPFHDRSGEFWISQSYGEDDRLFVSGALSVNNVQRAIQASRQAFDNTGHILVSFSSLRQDFSRSVFLNGYETEDIQTGAWGSATLEAKPCGISPDLPSKASCLRTTSISSDRSVRDQVSVPVERDTRTWRSEVSVTGAHRSTSLSQRDSAPKHRGTGRRIDNSSSTLSPVCADIKPINLPVTTA